MLSLSLSHIYIYREREREKKGQYGRDQVFQHVCLMFVYHACWYDFVDLTSVWFYNRERVLNRSYSMKQFDRAPVKIQSVII